MENNYSYNFTLKTVTEIFDAEQYIKNIFKNQQAAIALEKEIEEKVDAVCKFPTLNRDCSYYGIDDENVRYVQIKNYNLFYYVNKDKKIITFLAFIYSKKNISKEDISK